MAKKKVPIKERQRRVSEGQKLAWADKKEGLKKVASFKLQRAIAKEHASDVDVEKVYGKLDRVVSYDQVAGGFKLGFESGGSVIVSRLVFVHHASISLIEASNQLFRFDEKQLIKWMANPKGANDAKRSPKEEKSSVGEQDQERSQAQRNAPARSNPRPTKAKGAKGKGHRKG